MAILRVAVELVRAAPTSFRLRWGVRSTSGGRWACDWGPQLEPGESGFGFCCHLLAWRCAQGCTRALLPICRIEIFIHLPALCFSMEMCEERSSIEEIYEKDNFSWIKLVLVLSLPCVFKAVTLGRGSVLPHCSLACPGLLHWCLCCWYCQAPAHC